MARALRIQYPGAWYHLTARGIERRPLFRDDRDRAHLPELLPEAVGRYRLRLYAYVMMDNHYHLLLQIRDANLSAAMQRLGDSYAVWFNRRHRRVGHRYGNRHAARPAAAVPDDGPATHVRCGADRHPARPASPG